MKNVLIAILMLAAGVVHADTIIVGTASQANNSGATAGTDATSYFIKLGKDIDKSWDADVLFNNTRNNTSDGITAQYEIGLRYKYPVSTTVTTYLRATTGTIQVSRVPSQTYAGIEPGIIWRPMGGPFTTKIDHTIATGLNTDQLDVRLTRAQLAYDINKSYSAAIRRDWMRGDVDFDAWVFSLVYRY